MWRVCMDDERVVFAHVRFDSSIRKEFVASLKKYREFSAGVRKSETVALCHPIMPVGDGFGGRVVRINSRQL